MNILAILGPAARRRLAQAACALAATLLVTASAFAACEPVKGITVVETAHLTVARDKTGDTAALVLQGSATMASADHDALRDPSPIWICLAALPPLTINGRQICNLFDAAFHDGDVVSLLGNRLDFALRASAPVDRLHTTILALGSREPCAKNLQLTVAPLQGEGTGWVAPMPDALSAKGATYALRHWPAGGISFGQDTTSGEASQPGPSPEPDDSTNALLRQTLRFLVIATVLISAIQFAMAHGVRAESGVRRIALAVAPVRAMIAMVVSNALLVYLPSILMSEVRWLFSPSIYGLAASFWVIFFLLYPTVFLFMAVAGVTWWLLWRRRRPTAQSPTALLGVVTSQAVLIGATLTLIVVSMTLAPHGGAMPDLSALQVPYYAVSLLVAGIIAFSFRRLVSVSWRIACLLAVVATFSILAPPDGSKDGFDQAYAWFEVLAPTLSDMLLSAGFIVTAYLLAGLRDEEKDAGTIDRILFVLFLLSVVGFHDLTFVTAVAALCVWYAGDRLLFAGKPADAAQAAMPDSFLGERLTTAYLFGGGLTAAIFWTQAAWRGAIAPDNPVLSSVHVILDSFAMGFTGAVLLGVAYNRLRGASATSKAMFIAFAGLLTNIASEFGSVVTTRQVLQPLAECVSMIAGLLLVAVFVYDIPAARGRIRDPQSGTAKGTLLGEAVPILSGLAAAIVTAVLPIIFTNIGDQLRNIFQTIVTKAPPGTGFPH